jgi:hypothetical protein
MDLHSIVPSGYPFDPTWSPDGSKILFETSKNSRQDKYGFGREIYAVDADGSHDNRLTDLAPFSRTDEMPVWSPDENRILFARRFQTRGEWTMNPDGTCEEPFREMPMDGASWQPLAGAPPLPEQHCHAIAVETAIRPFHRFSKLLTVTIANDGTEPLTNVVLDTTAHNDVSVLGAEMGNDPPQPCSLVVRHIRCRAANLARGDRFQVFITLAARRVRIPRSSYQRLRTAFKVTTAEEVLPTPSESGELRFELSRCRNNMRGGGRIDGTRFADRICGRQGPDRIHPGSGKDVVSAGGGADMIFAVDGKVDRISCGAGRDTVLADRVDHVGRDCERVERR